jgi:hypothetical protein
MVFSWVKVKHEIGNKCAVLQVKQHALIEGMKRE